MIIQGQITLTNLSDGKSIVKVDNYYAWASSGTTAPTSWGEANKIPTHPEGKDYLWNYEKCIDADGGEVSKSNASCIGYYPKDGKGIKEIIEYYYVGTSDEPTNITISADKKSVTIPTGWSSSGVPTTDYTNRYVWNQEVTKYTDDTYSVSAIHISGVQGEKGKSIANVINYYKWDAQGSSIPSGTYSENTIPTHEYGKDYLWNYEVCKDEDGSIISTSTTTCIGYFPKGVEEIIEYYQRGTSTAPNAITVSSDGKSLENTTGWVTTQQSTTSTYRYLWNQEVVKYTDGTYSVGAVHTAGVQGQNGTSVTAQYAKSNIDGTVDTSTATTTFTVGCEWMRTSTDGTNYSSWMRIVGEKGDDGDYTNYEFGISNVKSTASSTESPTDISSWYDYPIPTTDAKPYLWCKETKYIKEVAQTPYYFRFTGENGADGTQPNLFGYDTKIRCIGGKHNIVHTKNGFSAYLYVDEDTSTSRYCLIRLDNIVDKVGYYSVSGYITKSTSGNFEYDVCDLDSTTMTLTANKRTRFEHKFKVTQERFDEDTAYRFVDFEFYNYGLVVIDSLKIEHTDDVIGVCTPYNGLANDEIVQRPNILLGTNFADASKWSECKGDIQTNALQGVSAFHYKNSTSSEVDVLEQNLTGKLKGSTWYTLSYYAKLTGTAYSFIHPNITKTTSGIASTDTNYGRDIIVRDETSFDYAPTDCNHLIEASGEWKKHSVTFITRPSLGTESKWLLFRVMGNSELYLSQIKLEECERATLWQLNEEDRMGAIGERGAILRGPTRWMSGMTYLSGAKGEQYQDIVINDKYPSEVYLCKYTHTASSSNEASSAHSANASWSESTPWTLSDFKEFVATKVLFAERGTIGNVNITGTITEETEKYNSSSNSIVVSGDDIRSVSISKTESYREESTYAFHPVVVLPTMESNTIGNVTINPYSVGGTKLSIYTSPIRKTYNWASFDWFNSLDDGNAIRQWFRCVLQNSTLVVSDPKLFTTHDIAGNSIFNAQSGNIAKYEYRHGRFSMMGATCRMILLPPGQHLHLVSSFETFTDETNYNSIVWSVLNGSDFSPMVVNAKNPKSSSYYFPFPLSPTYPYWGGDTPSELFFAPNNIVGLDTSKWKVQIELSISNNKPVYGIELYEYKNGSWVQNEN